MSEDDIFAEIRKHPDFQPDKIRKAVFVWCFIAALSCGAIALSLYSILM